MMKKTILVGLLMVALSLPSIGLAATVGSIAETQGALGKFSLGLEYDGVFDRDMDFDKGSYSINADGFSDSGPIPDPGDSIKDAQFESNRIFVKGAVGFHPNLDVFVKLGAANVDGEFKYVEPGFPDEKNEFDGDWDFAWGIGVKAKLYQSPGGLRIMADAQYLRYKVDGDIDIDGVDLARDDEQEALDYGATSATFSYDAEAKIEEWQVALYVNQTFGNFSPYAGVKYSDMDMEVDVDIAGRFDGVSYSEKSELDFEADDNFGIFLGTDIYLIPELLSINIEARFIDETAGTFGLTYRF
ncbi:MAG: hypothetical protein LWX51_03470 [Deltaproteobacteria bacterium]|jgi:hypothetical protein|nr:hypothetical protein [Deltaproteobacteria bacterium]